MPDPGPLPLPLTLEEITPVWLTAALRVRAPGVSVRDAEIVDVIRSTCTKVRLRLDLNEAGKRAGIPEVVMLKAGFEPHSRDMYIMHDMEGRWYRDVLPAQPLRAPACYFSDTDDERRQGVVIMEDLVRRGVEFCSGLRPHSYDAVARRLSALAGYHAHTWGSRELEPGGRWGWLQYLLASARAAMDVDFPPDVWKSYVDSPRGAAVSVRLHDRDWMCQALDKISAFGARLPHALIHTDTHPGNLYVDVDGEPGFLDSIPHRSPPMVEVAYHMVCALDLADRPRWEGALVQHYLDELRQFGVAAPSFEEAWEQYRLFLTYAYFVFILNASIFQTESVNTAYATRIGMAMLDHDTQGLLEQVAV
jgi:hypothetical protein